MRLLLSLPVCAVLLASGAAANAASTPSARAPTVQIRNGPRPGSLELLANGAVDLAPELSVERQRGDGGFEPVRNLDLDSMRIVATCDQRVKACVRVGRGGLRPVPWSGMSCSSQCNGSCDKNERLHGRFRFVVNSCDGATRFEGPVFAFP